MRLFILILLAGAQLIPARAADVIPSERRYNWQIGTNVGVPGGIYQYRGRTTSAITGLDNTGVTNAAGLIQAAIDAAADDTCLTIPAGTFRLDSGINVGIKSDGSAKKRITLRGAGMGQTILKTYGSASVGLAGGGSVPSGYPSAATIVSEVAAGATSATVSESVDFSGGFAYIYAPTDNTIPAWAQGSEEVRPILVYVTASTGSTFTFAPALPFRILAGSKFQRETGTGPPYYTTHAYRCGIEDLTVDAINATSVFATGLFLARECWFYNVEVKGFTNFAHSTAFVYLSTVRHCVVRDQIDAYPTASSRNGFTVSHSTGVEFTDNLVFNTVSGMEVNFGVTMSVFGYNMADRISIRDTLGSAWNINHGGHNSWNLYEGNIFPRIQPDGYFGSSSYETMVRNWLHGTQGVYTTDWGDTGVTVTSNRLPLTLNRYSRYFNVVGNLVGRTGLGISWERTNMGWEFDTTSTTSLSIGTGSKSFTFGTGLRYNNNGTAAIAYSTSSPTNWMIGRILDYNSGTGTCTMDVTRANGSGTFSDWTVIGGGGYGNNNLYSLGGPNIGAGGFWWGIGGIVAPQTRGIWWPAWDGRFPVQRGAFNGANTYNQSGTGTTGQADYVTYVAAAPYEYNTGNDVGAWMANNPAKSGTATWATPGPSQTDWLPLGSNSQQELDYDVFGTAIFKGNWNALDDAISSFEGLGGDTVATSYAYSSKPGYLGTASGADRNWPVFDAASPNQSFTANGAGYRYNFFKTNATWDGSEPAGYSADDSGAPPPSGPDATYTPTRLAPAMLRRR